MKDRCLYVHTLGIRCRMERGHSGEHYGTAPTDLVKKKAAPDARKRVSFCIQSTTTFVDGAPDRAEYATDRDHWEASARYDADWVREYVCVGCDGNVECPQHGEVATPPTFKDNGDFCTWPVMRRKAKP